MISSNYLNRTKLGYEKDYFAQIWHQCSIFHFITRIINTKKKRLFKYIVLSLKFPLMPMGVLATGCVHSRPSALPPSTLGCPILLKILQTFLSKNMSFQYMKCLVSWVFRVFLHCLKFPPWSLKIQRCTLFNYFILKQFLWSYRTHRL